MAGDPVLALAWRRAESEESFRAGCARSGRHRQKRRDCFASLAVTNEYKLPLSLRGAGGFAAISSFQPYRMSTGPGWRRANMRSVMSDRLAYPPAAASVLAAGNRRFLRPAICVCGPLAHHDVGVRIAVGRLVLDLGDAQGQRDGPQTAQEHKSRND